MVVWLTSLALAGSVYINGTLIDPHTVPGVSLEKVNVRFDAQGNVLIDAPGYKIEVVDPPGAPAPAPSMSAAPPMPQPVAPSASAVAPARWWLVTEDNSTTGHSIEVVINGKLAFTIASGQPQKIVDVGGWLVLGQNTVTVRSNSTNPTGGTLYVFMGTGSDSSGTVEMKQPLVQYGVGSTRTGPMSRDFTIAVDR